MKGIKHDDEKVPLDLLPFDALLEIAKVYQYGAQKYARRNWEDGMRWGRMYAALHRHMWAWWEGENKDKETDLSHLIHASFCLLSLVAYELRRAGEDDRPLKPSRTGLKKLLSKLK